MSRAEERLYRLLPSIYEAGADSERWTAVLAEVAEYLGGTACALTVHNFGQREGTIYKAAGYDAAYVRSYIDRYASLNIWLEREGPYRRPGTVNTDRDLTSDEELLRSEFYSDWLRPQHFRHRLCAVILREGAAVCYLAVMRPAFMGDFEAEEVSRAGSLLPHLQQAVRLHRTLAMLQSERDAALDALNRLPIGVVFVDERGAPLVANDCAEEILRASDGLTIRQGALRGQTLRETEQLQGLIAEASRTARGRGIGPGGSIALQRPSGARPLEVLVAPLRAGRELLGARRTAAAVFVTDSETPGDISEEPLRRLYGLSKGEARVAAALARGHSLEEAARTLRLSTNNARAHLKRVFAKTGVSRQSELVRLLLLGPAQLRGP